MVPTVSRPPYCAENWPAHYHNSKQLMTSDDSNYKKSEIQMAINEKLSSAFPFNWYNWTRFCIDEYKSSILRGQLSVPNILNPVYCAINYCFKYGTNLVILTRAGSFRSCNPQYTLRKKAYPSLYYSYQTNTRLFVKRHQSYRHKCTIVRPWRALIA